MVLDLFAAGSSRKAVVNALSTAIDASRTATGPYVEALHRRLAAARDTLVASHDAMHEPRSPWGIALAGAPSFDGAPPTWGLHDWALATRTHAHRPVRLDLAALQRWDPATHETLRGVVEDFVANGGTDPAATGPGWSWAALTYQQKVVAADQVASDLLQNVLALHAMCAQSSAVTGLPAPVTIDDARHIVVNVNDAQQVHAAGGAAAFDPSLPTEDLNRQVAALAGKAVRKDLSVKVGFFERRRIAAQVHAAYPNLSDPGSTLLLALKTRQMFERET